MSKINQIQRALLELEGGSFQKLADAYLHKKGYERINPLGSLIGSDKVKKGTPDTLVSLPNGKYVFAEHTTQQDKVYGKLKSDLENCLDEAKTEIPVEKIEEMVFCHTSTLSTEEENALAAKCQKNGVNLNIFGIGPISFDLYQKYPGLARDFLGVEVDTGQIVPPDEFVATYNKNNLATRLDIAFHFREEEVERVLQGFETRDLVIVTGRAGVGKSRLALECCEQYKKVHPEYEVRCVFNRGSDLFDDLRVHFSEPGCFLILADDANRISRFDYVVQLLQDQREDQQIKVIATVRDYALDKVRESARPHGGATEVELQLLEEKQIKQLVEDEYSIRNHLYLDRIADIAQGNPRLAIMAAEVAKRENTLHSISDVSALYDEYFVSIRRDIKGLGDWDLLKAAGIVAFFRAVDHSNEEMTGAIGQAFGVSFEAFWEAARRLHDLEVLDMYEDEVVRTSDQVLATYLFYLAFFKEQALDFSALLGHFFPRLRDRLVDAISPVLNAFDSETIMEAMRPHVDRTWEAIKKAGNEQSLLHLMHVFWFLKQTDILLYIRDWIENKEAESVDLSDIDFKADSDIPSPSLLSVLGSFKYADNNTFRMALSLLFDYLAKRPRELPQVLHLLTDRFRFQHTSYTRGFTVQRAVIDVLWERARDGKDELFSKLFLTVVEQYLHTRFHTTEPKGRHAFTMIDFQLPPTPGIFELRRAIWRRLFQLYQTSALREAVLSVLYSYSTSGHLVSVNEIVAQDAVEVLPFINSELNPTIYHHCLVVHDFLDLLMDRKVLFDQELRDRFTNATYGLSRLLLFDRTEMRRLDLNYEEFQQLKKEQIEEHFDGFIFADYEHFFEQCLDIQADLGQDHEKFQLQNGVVDVLLILAGQYPDLYTKVLGHYLILGDPLRLNSVLLVERLIKACGAERAYDILSRPNYPTKRGWLLRYYHSLPPDEVTAEHLDQLYILYQEATLEELPRDFDFLLNYRSLEEKVVTRVTEILLEKAEASSDYAYALSMLFNPHTEVNKSITDLFANDLHLLKRAYFAVLETRRYEDYNGQTFARILNLDPDFILEYIDQMYEGKEWLSRYEDTRDYSFLWKRDDCEELMTRVAERVYDLERSRLLGTYLETFFGLRENGTSDPEVKEKQDCFLRGLIKRRYQDPDFMEFVFRVIAQFPPERRRTFVALFLEYNKRFEDFQRLPLESCLSSWSGSAVPMLQGRVEYFESVLPLLNTMDLLQHKQYVERRIQEIRSEIEWEKKRNFIED